MFKLIYVTIINYCEVNVSVSDCASVIREEKKRTIDCKQGGSTRRRGGKQLQALTRLRPSPRDIRIPEGVYEV